jgi:hypothetical protein
MRQVFFLSELLIKFVKLVNKSSIETETPFLFNLYIRTDLCRSGIVWLFFNTNKNFWGKIQPVPGIFSSSYGGGVRSFYSGSRQYANLNLSEHSSSTALSLGRLSKSLLVLVAFTFERNWNFLQIPEQWYIANNFTKDFIINHNESDLRRPGMEPGSPDSRSSYGRDNI